MEYFEKELNYIINPNIKKITQLGISIFPNYFYKVSASSSNKYHPSYAIGDGGLYRHVQAAVRIAVMLFRCESVFQFTQDEKDLVVASLILHDSFKQGVDGSNGHTLHDHPIIASEMLQERVVLTDESEKYFLDMICANIESHMGQWQTSNFSKVVLPLPKSDMQKFVHLCDYRASRKPLEFNFSVPVV